MGKVFERRNAVRYTVVDNQAVIGWSEGEQSLQTPAYLKSISQSGAFLETEKPVPPGTSVWVRLERPATTDWTEASVIDSPRTPGLLLFRKPRYYVRLKFSSVCPYEVFKAATHGDSLTARAEGVSPEFDNRDWR
jgi:hypothetical protein